MAIASINPSVAACPPIIRRVTVTGDGDEFGVEVASIGRRSRAAAVQLLVRTGAVRLIAFIGTIILARLLGPDDFGAFAVVIFVVGILTPFGDLGLGATLVQQRERPTETELATVFTAQLLAWIGLVGLAWGLAPLVKFLAPDLPPDIDWMVRVVAVGVFISHLRSVAASTMSRVLRFGPLAGIEVAQQLTYTVVAVVSAFSGAGAWSFVYGLMAMFVVGTALTFLAWGRLPPFGIDVPVLRRMVSFGVSFQLTGLINLGREGLIPLFGNLAGGAAAIGYLQFSRRLGRLVGSVDEIIGRIAFPTFSRLQTDRRRLSRALLHAIETSAILLSPVIWTVAVAPTLIPIVFSDRWTPAVLCLQLMALSALAGVQAQYLLGLGFAARQTRAILFVSAAALAATLALFPFLLLTFGVAGGGLAFLINGALLLVGYSYVTRKLVAFPWTRLLRLYAIGAVAGVTAAVCVALVSGLPGLVFSVPAFGITYLSLMLLFERAQVSRSWQLMLGRAEPRRMRQPAGPGEQ